MTSYFELPIHDISRTSFFKVKLGLVVNVLFGHKHKTESDYKAPFCRGTTCFLFLSTGLHGRMWNIVVLKL